MAALEPEPGRARDQLARLGDTPEAVAKTIAKLSRKGFADESLEGFVATDGGVA
jgi:hypothetical protein